MLLPLWTIEGIVRFGYIFNQHAGSIRCTTCNLICYIKIPFNYLNQHKTHTDKQWMIGHMIHSPVFWSLQSANHRQTQNAALRSLKMCFAYTKFAAHMQQSFNEDLWNIHIKRTPSIATKVDRNSSESGVTSIRKWDLWVCTFALKYARHGQQPHIVLASSAVSTVKTDVPDSWDSYKGVHNPFHTINPQKHAGLGWTVATYGSSVHGWTCPSKGFASIY